MEFIYNENSLKSGIYRITNKVNGKIYIGSCKLFKVRAYQHLKSLRNNSHQNKHLQSAFNKDREDAFIFEVLEVIEGDKISRTQREKELFDIEIQSGNWENCYNFQKNPVSNERSCFSKDPKETKKKLSELSKKMWADPKWKEEHLARIEKATTTPEATQKKVEGQKRAWKNDFERKEKQSKFLKEQMSDPNVKNKRTSALLQNQLKGRETFKERMKNDLDFKKKYQEIGRQNIAKRNVEQPKKKYPLLLSPIGEIYEICGVPTFCKKHGLIKQLLYNVLNRKSKSHNGWILA